MTAAASNRPRVRVDGKFFRLGAEKFYVKGLTYGPLRPNRDGEPFASAEQTVHDFSQLNKLGANLLRLYHLPPVWFLELAAGNGLQLLVDIPWNKHLCFLDSKSSRQEVRRSVRQAAVACAAHPTVMGVSVVNEIPPDIVRWSGPDVVAKFIDELIDIVKSVDGDCLCTFGNFPPTEYLRPAHIDFLCFNVYLHDQRPYENYLARLQMIADTKPLLLGEFGIDSLREGEKRQAEILGWQIESSFRGGAGGTVLYSFTDEWYKENGLVEDWAFGVTTRERIPKPAFSAIQEQFRAAPYFPLPDYPRVSVVVACYNGVRTLETCLDSLTRLNYPDYEVIFVDDGSTDASANIAKQFAQIRYIYQENQGLSGARNTGIQAATGEIVAFTDADCRADEDWLHYLIQDLLAGGYTGIGGHNLLPPEDSWVAAAVMVSPGGPAHVMLTDRLAEHVPGCNMAFYKWALLEIQAFDPMFHQAGDDVDLCWRLQQHGYQIGFSPGGFVWHYRRSTVTDYLKQQYGYGESEALLLRKHPEYLNWSGGSIWRGRIYAPGKLSVAFSRPIIYYGLFGSGFFQSLYAAKPASTLMLLTSLEYHVFVTVPLLVLSVPFPTLLPLAVTSAVASGVICVAAAFQAELPIKKRRWCSRPLIALLFFLQPIFRGLARYQGRLFLRPVPLKARETLVSKGQQYQDLSYDEVQYWAEGTFDRLAFVQYLLKRLDNDGWQNKEDAGWHRFDVEIYGSRWSRLQLTTAAEVHQGGKHLLRCRLQRKWTLPSKIMFCSVLAVELLILGTLRHLTPWMWTILLTLPLFAGIIHHQQRHLQRLIAVLLDQIAKEFDLVKIDHPARDSSQSARRPAG